MSFGNNWKTDGNGVNFGCLKLLLTVDGCTERSKTRRTHRFVPVNQQRSYLFNSSANLLQSLIGSSSCMKSISALLRTSSRLHSAFLSSYPSPPPNCPHSPPLPTSLPPSPQPPSPLFRPYASLKTRPKQIYVVNELLWLSSGRKMAFLPTAG